MANNILNEDDCKKILQNRFKDKDVQFIDFEIKPISENVEGFLGEHYNMYINYKIHDEIKTDLLFLKTKPTAKELQITLCNAYNAFKKEIFIYETLIEEFNKYGFNTNFAPTFYYCIPEKLLVLENLVGIGFILFDKHNFFNLNIIKSSLKSLALFHSAGLAYQQKKSEESKNYSFERKYRDILKETLFTFYSDPTHITMNWWNNGIKTLSNLIDLLPENERYKTEFKNMFQNFSFGKVFVEKSQFAKTCTHGDLWSNNLLFKYDNNSIVDCLLVDFQFCRYFYPCFDVLLVIYANTNSEFRMAHLKELYEYYYEELKRNLSNYGYSIQNLLPVDDFYESIRITKADALLQVLCSLAVLYLPTEVFTGAVKDDNDDAINDIMFNNTSICCKTFENDSRYRKILSETLQEMRLALLAMK